MTADGIRTRLDAIEALAVKWNDDPTYGICGCERCRIATEVLPLVAALRDALAEVEGQTLVARSYEQERDAARSRLVDATAQIKRLAAENARLGAQVQAGLALCDEWDAGDWAGEHVRFGRSLRTALAATEAGEES